MGKFLSVMMVLAFLAGGTAWAQTTAGPGDSGPLSHSSKKHSKKSKKRKSGKRKKKKKGKGAKGKAEAKMENGTVTKGDLEINLKGQ